MQDDVKLAMLNMLTAHSNLVPEGLLIEHHKRYDSVLKDYHLSVHVRPADVDPDTFTFGTPGGYASIRAESRGDGEFKFYVHLMTTNVGWTFQQAGHAVGFTSAADAVSTAVREIEVVLADQRRGRIG